MASSAPASAAPAPLNKVTVVQSGYIFKKDGKSKLPGKSPGWKRRFFILDTLGLSYLKSDKPGAKLYGRIALTDVQAIQQHQPTAAQQLWTLDIHTKERTYFLSSPNESEINLWTLNLTAFITIHTPGADNPTANTATNPAGAPSFTVKPTNSGSFFVNVNSGEQAPSTKSHKRQVTSLSTPIPTVNSSTPGITSSGNGAGNGTGTGTGTGTAVNINGNGATTTTTSTTISNNNDDFGFTIINDTKDGNGNNQPTSSLKQTITQMVVNAVAPLKQSQNITISPDSGMGLGGQTSPRGSEMTKPISLCGAAIVDYAKSFSSGYITTMIAVAPKKIWTGDNNGNIVTWSCATDRLKKVSQWKPHTQQVTSLVYVPSKNIIYSASTDSKICAWNENDLTPVFTHSSRVPIHSMVEINDSLLLYCGYSDNFTSLTILDINTQTAREIPLNSYIQSIEAERGVQHHGKKKKDIRKFYKIIKYDDRILIATTFSEIIVWSPWDGEVCHVLDIGYQSISGMAVIGNTLWICSLPDSSTSSFFTPNLPNVVSLWNLNTFKKKRSFDCTHPISSFNIFNGYVWAINRHHIDVYEPNSGQGVFEQIDLGQDMNCVSMYNNDCAWVGGNHLFIFKLVDTWVERSLATQDFNPDINNWEYLEQLLKKLSNRFKYNYDDRILDLLLNISESDQLLVQFHLIIVKTLRYYSRNQSYVTEQILMGDTFRLDRMANLLISHLKNRTDPLLHLHTMKTLYYLCNFTKFCGKVALDVMLKFSVQSMPSSILKYTLLVIVKLTSLQTKIPMLFGGPDENYRKMKDILEYYFKLLEQPFSASNDDGDLIKHCVIYILKRIYEIDDKRYNELILKKQCIQALHKIARAAPPTYFSHEAQALLQLLMSNNPKISEMISKLGGMIIDNNTLDEPTMLIYQLTEPRTKKKRSATRPESSTSGPLTSNSPITSLLYTLNSLLHSVQNTTLKSTKITIKEISVPESFPDHFTDRQSIIQLQAILNGFQAHFAVELNPKDLKIRVQIAYGGLSGEATISDPSLQGTIIVGFHHGSAKPHWISFSDEPKIDFKFTTTTLLKPVDLIIKPALQRIIKAKMVYPNKVIIT